jgi:hypothetical protein
MEDAMKFTLLGTLALIGCAQQQHFIVEETPLIQKAPVELIKNGGFESPQLQTGSWNVFNTADGWCTSFGAGIEIQNNVAGSPFEGAQHVELDSHGASGMYQDVNTDIGKTYTLRFSSIARGGTAQDDNIILVLWDGQVIDEVTPPVQAWRVYQYELTARSASTRLEFRDASVSNGLGAYLDAVSLMEVSDLFTLNSAPSLSAQIAQAFKYSTRSGM